MIIKYIRFFYIILLGRDFMRCYKNSSNFSWVKGESERKDHSYHHIFIINPIKIQLSNLYFLTFYFIQKKQNQSSKCF
jgi:hypothetical protein